MPEYLYMFIFNSILFAVALVLLLRSLMRWKRNDVAVFFILTVYALLSVFTQLGWSDIGNRFGG